MSSPPCILILEAMDILGPLVTTMIAMRRIEAVSSDLLTQKINESLFISADDSASKKDIMSLLVRARANEEKIKADARVSDKGLESSSSEYRMSNEEMMGQVVSARSCCR